MDYTTSGLYIHTGENEAGCVHTDSLDLTINEATSSYDEVEGCEVYNWNGVDYTATGLYIITGENEAGCVQTDSLDLTILQPTESTDTAIACGTYEWYGIVYTESGLYSHVDDSGVCPHTYYLDLVIEECGDEVCENFKYFYIASNTPGVANGTVFTVDLSGTNAVLTELFQTGFDDAHIAVNEDKGYIYVISGEGNQIVTYDMAGIFQHSAPILGLNRTTAMAYDPDPTDPGKVLVGDQNLKKVYRLDPINGTYTTFVESAPVFGGDIFFIGDQSYLVERVGSSNSNVWNISTSFAVPVPLASTVAPAVNGASATANNGFIVASGNYSTSFYTYDDATGSSEQEYAAIFANGDAFTIVDGDMAGGCFDGVPVIDDCDFVMYLASDQNTGVGGATDIYSMTINPDKTTNNTFITTLDFPCHGLAYSPEGDEGRLYMIETAQTHSSYVVWDISLDAPLGSPITMVTNAGKPIPNVPTGVYKDGVLYAASYKHNKVYFINPTTGIAFSSISTDVNGGDLVFDKNGDLWYAHRYTQTFTKLTLPSSSFVIPSLANIHGVALMENGNFMVANGDGGSEFYEVDPVAGELVTGGLYETGIDQLWGDLAGVDCFGAEVITPELAGSNSSRGNVEIEATAIMSSYPNPTTGASKVSFTVPSTEMTTLEVYDMNGRSVATIFNQVAEKDQAYVIDFNGANLPNGVYIYRLTTTDSTIIDKFMIAR